MAALQHKNHHQVEEDDSNDQYEHTYPPYCPKPSPKKQPQYLVAIRRAFTNAINGATTSNSKRSSSSISPSSSSVSSFFFTNSCSSDNLIHPQPSYHCRGHFRGREAIGFRCYFHLSINRLKLEQLLSLIGTMRHANLVQLIGASVSKNEPYAHLIYDFMQGPTLSHCLTSSSSSSKPNTTISSSSSITTNNNNIFRLVSTWMSRMEIALGVARGLDYIHHRTGFDVVLTHNNINSTNIIINRTSQQTKPMICNFGLALANGQTAATAAAANGLLDNVDEQHGCLHSPEIQRQSDVYGFGVLLLELLSGKEPLKYNIVQTARLIFSCGEEEDEIDNKVRLWMDERLTNFFPLKIAKNVMRVALLCLSMDHSERPDMAFMEGFIFDCIRMSNNIKYYQIL